MSAPTFTYKLPNGKLMTFPSDISEGAFKEQVQNAILGPPKWLSQGGAGKPPSPSFTQAHPSETAVAGKLGEREISTATSEPSKWTPDMPIVAGTDLPDRMMNQVLTYPNRILMAGKKAIMEPIEAIRTAYTPGPVGERALKVGFHLVNAFAGGLETAYRTADWPMFMAFDAGTPAAQELGGAMAGQKGKEMAGAVMNLLPALMTGDIKTGGKMALLLGGGIGAQELMQKVTSSKWARSHFSARTLSLANEAAGSAGFIAAILGMKKVGEMEGLKNEFGQTLEISARTSKNAADFVDNVSAHPLYPYLEEAAKSRSPLKIERTDDRENPFAVSAGNKEIGRFSDRRQAESLVKAKDLMDKYGARKPSSFFRKYVAKNGTFRDLTPEGMKEVRNKDVRLASMMAREDGRLNAADRLSRVGDAIDRTNESIVRGKLRQATAEAQDLRRLASDPEVQRYMRRSTKAIQNSGDLLQLYDEENFSPTAYAAAAERLGNPADATTFNRIADLHQRLIVASKDGDAVEAARTAEKLQRLTRKSIRTIAWYKDRLGDRSGTFEPQDVAELQKSGRRVVKVGTQAGMPVYFDMDTRGMFALVPSVDDAGHAEYHSVNVPPDMVRFESQPWADFAKAQGLGPPEVSQAYENVLKEYQSRLRDAEARMSLSDPTRSPEFVRQRVLNEVAPAIADELQQQYPGLNVKEVLRTREASERMRQEALAKAPPAQTAEPPKPQSVEASKTPLRDFLENPTEYKRYSGGTRGRDLAALTKFDNVEARARTGKYGDYYQFYSAGKPIKGLTVKTLPEAETMLMLHSEMKAAGVGTVDELRLYHLVSQPGGTVSKESLADVSTLEQVPKGRRDQIFSQLKKLKSFEYRKIRTKEGDKFIAYAKGRPQDGTILETEEQARSMDRAVRYGKQQKLKNLDDVIKASRTISESTGPKPPPPAAAAEKIPAAESMAAQAMRPPEAPKAPEPAGETHEVPELPQEVQTGAIEPQVNLPDRATLDNDAQRGVEALIAMHSHWGEALKLEQMVKGGNPSDKEIFDQLKSFAHNSGFGEPGGVDVSFSGNKVEVNGRNLSTKEVADAVRAVIGKAQPRVPAPEPVVQVTPRSSEQSHVAAGPPIDAVQGNRAVMRVGMNETRTGRYAVVELSDLKPSHDPITFEDNPEYPHRNGVNINPRDYSLEANRVHVDEGAKNFDPGAALADVEAVSIGPPKVAPDGTVIGHNGMTMMMQRAADMYPHNLEKYRNTLLQRLDQFGIDHDAMKDMTEPVLVTIIDKPEYTTEELNRYNYDPQKGESSAERSAKLSAMLKEDPAFEKAIMSTIAKYETIGDFYRSREDSEFLLRQMLDRGVIQANKLGDYWSNEGFSEAGRNLIEDAILGAVLDPATVNEVQKAGIRAMGSAIATAYGPLLRTAKISAEYDLRPWLNEAVGLQADFRAHPNLATLRQYLSQPDLFTVKTYRPESLALNVASNAGPKIFKGFVDSYNKSAELSAQGGGLFGGSQKLSPLETLWKAAQVKLPPKAQDELATVDPAFSEYAAKTAKQNEQGGLFVKNNMTVASMDPEAQNAAIQYHGAAKDLIDGLYGDRPTRICKAFQDKQVKGEHLEFRGQTIERPEDEAMIAQVIRNPHREYSLVIYKDPAGKVLSTEVFSIGAPGSSIGPLTLRDHILDRMKALGSSTFAFAHNHPGTQPDFSMEDLSTYAKTKADPQIGHLMDHFLVVNTGRFSVVGAGGLSIPGGVTRTDPDIGVVMTYPINTDDWFYQPKEGEDVLGLANKPTSDARSFKNVVDQVRDISLETNRPILIGISATMAVRSVDVIPTSWGPDEIAGYMRDLLGKDGTERFHVVLPAQSPLEYGVGLASRKIPSLPSNWSVKYLREEDLQRFPLTADMQKLFATDMVDRVQVTTPGVDVAVLRGERPYYSDRLVNEVMRKARTGESIDPYIVREAKKRWQDNPIAFIDEALTPKSGMVREENAYTEAKNAWKKTRDWYYSWFSPEVASPRAQAAASLAGEAIGLYQHGQAVIVNSLQKSWDYWHQNLLENDGQDRALEFMDNVLGGKTKPSDFTRDGEVLAPMAQQMKASFDKAFDNEQRRGLAGAYMKDYFPGLWDRRDISDVVLRQLQEGEPAPERTITTVGRGGRKLGADPYANEKLIPRIKKGLEMGLHLRSANPVDLWLSRLFDSERMCDQQDFLNKAVRAKLVRRTGKPGDVRFPGPGGDVYYAPKDVYRVLDNAFGVDKTKLLNKSLWSMDNPAGTFYRKAMALKNYTIPVKLSMSMFHPIHIMSIGQSAFSATTYARMLDGTLTPDGALKELARSNTMAWDKLGWDVVKHWDSPDQASPEGREAMHLIELGGGNITKGTRYYSQSLDFRQTMRDAMASGPVRRLWNVPLEFVRHLVVAYQAPMFDDWIPTMKVASYVRDIKSQIEADPSLEAPDGWLKLRMAARRAWQRADNEFGMVNYQTIFAKHMLKDIGIGMNLSLGWTLGFMRMYSGAAYDVGAYGARTIDGWRGKTAEDVAGQYADIMGRDKFDWKNPSTRRLAFVADYTFRAMAYAGLLSWALTGKPPSELMDYVFPRLTADGKRRLSTPFYTRDLYNIGHDVAMQGIGPGAWRYASGKIQPSLTLLNELWNNENFYGYQIVDPSAPITTQAAELGSYVISSMAPISMSSISEAAPLKERALAVAGFTKAPATATRSETANLIQNLYRERFGGHKPYQKGQQVKAMREIDDALEFGDEKKALALQQEALDKGLMTQDQISRFLEARAKNRDASVMQFQRLGTYGTQDQLQVIEQAPADELGKYVPVARLEIRKMMPELAEKYPNVRDYWLSLPPDTREHIESGGRKTEDEFLKRIGLGGEDPFMKRMLGGTPGAY